MMKNEKECDDVVVGNFAEEIGGGGDGAFVCSCCEIKSVVVCICLLRQSIEVV